MRRPHAPPSRAPSWRLGALSSRHPHHPHCATFGLPAQALAAVALLALVALRPALVDRAGTAVATRRARAGVTVWQEGDVAADSAIVAAAGALPGHNTVSDSAAAASAGSLRNNDADDLLAALSDDALDIDALAAELDSDRGDAAAARVGAVKTTNGVRPAGGFASTASQSLDDVSDVDVLEALASLGDLDGPPKAQQRGAAAGVQPVEAAALAAITSTPSKKASPLDDIDLDALAAAVLEEMEAEESARAKAAPLKPAPVKPAAASLSAVDPGSDTPLAGGDPLMQRLDGGIGGASSLDRARLGGGGSSSNSLLDDLDDLEDDYDDEYDDDYDDDLDLLDGLAAAKPVVKPGAAQPVPVAAAAAVHPAAVAPLAVKPAAVKPAVAASSTTSSTTQPPVRILMMNRFYFGDRYARSVPQCAWGGEPLQCEFFADASQVADADAIAYHIPGMTGAELDSLPPLADDQPIVGVSMESDANYPLLADAAFVDKFDILSTLALSSDVWLPYYDDAAYRGCWTAHPPPAPATRKAALAYVNSNCATASGRDEMVAAIAKAAGAAVPMHAYGECLNNMPASERAASKVDTLKRYKFCITIENSVSRDYVSEKVYDALVAGCVPIYYGAPNIADYVPHPDAIIDVSMFDGPAAVAAELIRLASDDAALAAKHAWRAAPDAWSPAFKQLVRSSAAAEAGEFDDGAADANASLPPPPPAACGTADSHMKRQCLLCQAVAEWQEAAAGEEEV